MLAPLSLPETLTGSLRLTPEQFAEFCTANPDAVLELAADGSLITMTPTGGETGARNSTLAFLLQLAIRHSGLPLKLFAPAPQADGLPSQWGQPGLAADPRTAGGGNLGAAGRPCPEPPPNRARRPFGWGAPVSGAGDRSGGDLGGLRDREPPPPTAAPAPAGVAAWCAGRSAQSPSPAAAPIAELGQALQRQQQRLGGVSPAAAWRRDSRPGPRSGSRAGASGGCPHAASRGMAR